MTASKKITSIAVAILILIALTLTMNVRGLVSAEENYLPTITLTGELKEKALIASSAVLPMATAEDSVDGTIGLKLKAYYETQELTGVTMGGSFNLANVGSYKFVYEARNSRGYYAQVIKTVDVKKHHLAIILDAANSDELKVGVEYVMSSAKAVGLDNNPISGATVSVALKQGTHALEHDNNRFTPLATGEYTMRYYSEYDGETAELIKVLTATGSMPSLVIGNPPKTAKKNQRVALPEPLCVNSDGSKGIATLKVSRGGAPVELEEGYILVPTVDGEYTLEYTASNHVDGVSVSESFVLTVSGVYEAATETVGGCGSNSSGGILTIVLLTMALIIKETKKLCVKR